MKLRVARWHSPAAAWKPASQSAQADPVYPVQQRQVPIAGTATPWPLQEMFLLPAAGTAFHLPGQSDRFPVHARHCHEEQPSCQKKEGLEQVIIVMPITFVSLNHAIRLGIPSISTPAHAAQPANQMSLALLVARLHLLPSAAPRARTRRCRANQWLAGPESAALQDG